MGRKLVEIKIHSCKGCPHYSYRICKQTGWDSVIERTCLKMEREIEQMDYPFPDWCPLQDVED